MKGQNDLIELFSLLTTELSSVFFLSFFPSYLKGLESIETTVVERAYGTFDEHDAIDSGDPFGCRKGNLRAKKEILFRQSICIICIILNKTGASMYQAMSLALACFTELHVTTPIAILRTALALNENVPARCRPLGYSVPLQIFSAALYSSLLDIASYERVNETPCSKEITTEINSDSVGFNDPTQNDKIAVSNALAEAICSMDEDNKHTAQIDYFTRVIDERYDGNCDLIEERSRIVRNPIKTTPTIPISYLIIK